MNRLIGVVGAMTAWMSLAFRPHLRGISRARNDPHIDNATLIGAIVSHARPDR
jgi:hypothetical protein